MDALLRASFLRIICAFPLTLNCSQQQYTYNVYALRVRMMLKKFHAT